MRAKIVYSRQPFNSSLSLSAVVVYRANVSRQLSFAIQIKNELNLIMRNVLVNSISHSGSCLERFT